MRHAANQELVSTYREVSRSVRQHYRLLLSSTARQITLVKLYMLSSCQISTLALQLVVRQDYRLRDR